MRFDDELLVWVMKEYLSKCKQRDIALRKSKKSDKPTDKLAYRKLRNKVVRFRNTLKQDYFLTVFNAAGSDQKKL